MMLVSFKMTGSTALLMHNDQLANPISEASRLLAAATAEVKKKNNDMVVAFEAKSLAEWRGGLYFEEGIGPVVPASMVRAAVIEGAKAAQTRRGKTNERALVFIEQAFPLVYDGGPHKTIESFEADWRNYRDIRSVGVNQSRVMRTRPIFRPGWTCKATFLLANPDLDLDGLRDDVLAAGRLVGVGDGRAIGMGRFRVSDFKATELADEAAA